MLIDEVICYRIKQKQKNINSYTCRTVTYWKIQDREIKYKLKICQMWEKNPRW